MASPTKITKCRRKLRNERQAKERKKKVAKKLEKQSASLTAQL